MLVNRLPCEILLNIFCKLTTINDAINLSYCNNYTSQIFKTHIDRIISRVVNNINFRLIQLIITLLYLVDKPFEMKFNTIKKIGNYLANNDNEILIKNHTELISYIRNNPIQSIPYQRRFQIYYYLRIFYDFNHSTACNLSHFNQNDLNKLLNLIKDGYDFNISFIIIYNNLNDEQFNLMKTLTGMNIHIRQVLNIISNIQLDKTDQLFKLINQNIELEDAVEIINNFNDEQIEKMNRAIELGVHTQFVTKAITNFNDQQLNLFIKISSLIEDNNDSTLWGLIHEYATPQEMKIIIKLLENECDIYTAKNISHIISDNENNEQLTDTDNNLIDRYIELYRRGIKYSILEEMSDNINNNDFITKMFLLIEEIKDMEVAFLIVENNISDNKIKKIIHLIKENISPYNAYILAKMNLSNKKIQFLKPYIRNIICGEYFIESILKQEVQPNLKKLEAIGMNNDNIFKLINNIHTKCIFGMKFKYINDIVVTLEQLMSLGCDADFAIQFIIDYTYNYNAFLINNTHEIPNENIYNSLILNTCMLLIKNGVKDIDILIYIIKLDSKYINIILSIINSEYNIYTFDKIQLDLLIHFVEENINLNEAIRYLTNTDKSILKSIYNYASFGVKYTTAYRQMGCTQHCYIRFAN